MSGQSTRQQDQFKYLFVDDAIVQAKQGVGRTLHPATKLEHPVMVPERPWEATGDCRRIYVYGTILHDPEQELFRMWYMGRMDHDHGRSIPGLYKPYKRDELDTLGRRFVADDVGDLTLYATSRDGIHWEKPDVGVFAFDGSRRNNIVYDLHGASVLLDELEPDPQKRFKMAGFCRRYRDIRAYHSPDGLSWQEFPGNPIVRRKSEGTFNVVRDPTTGRYMACLFYVAGRRCVAVSTSDEFDRGWSSPKLIFVPDEQDDAWVREPGQRTEFYGMVGFPYGGQYLGLLNVFRIHSETQNPARGQAAVDGPIDVQLTHSRDGLHWERFENRSAIIPNGAPGTYDSGCILHCAREPVFCSNEMWVYYTAINTTHGDLIENKHITIGRASWRVDGFVSLDAGPLGGTVETVSLRASRCALEVNADASRGTISVEVLSADGPVLPGYSAQECRVMRGDEVWHHLRWQGTDWITADQPIRLRFHLKDASLYSFCMRPASIGPSPKH